MHLSLVRVCARITLYPLIYIQKIGSSYCLLLLPLTLREDIAFWLLHTLHSLLPTQRERKMLKGESVFFLVCNACMPKTCYTDNGSNESLLAMPILYALHIIVCVCFKLLFPILAFLYWFQCCYPVPCCFPTVSVCYFLYGVLCIWLWVNWESWLAESCSVSQQHNLLLVIPVNNVNIQNSSSSWKWKAREKKEHGNMKIGKETVWHEQ